jgi:uncharacterized membrane protein (DUF106 family)
MSAKENSMTVDIPLENLENAIEELKKSAKEIQHKRTRQKIEKTIALMEESKNKIARPQEQRRSFKSLYFAVIPFVVVFLAVGVYYFGNFKKFSGE